MNPQPDINQFVYRRALQMEPAAPPVLVRQSNAPPIEVASVIVAECTFTRVKDSFCTALFEGDLCLLDALTRFRCGEGY